MKKTGWIHIPTGYSVLDAILEIDGWLMQGEVCALYHYALEAVRTHGSEAEIVEIGSYQGRSTVALGLACKEAQKGIVHAIDPHRDSLEQKFLHSPTLDILKQNISKFRLKKYVNVVVADSIHALKKFHSRKIVLVFIDGDHAYKEVQKDVYGWGEKLIPSGYLLLHDTINVQGPAAVFSELMTGSGFAYVENIGELAIFRKNVSSNTIGYMKNLFAYSVYRLLYRIYRASNDIAIHPALLH